MRRRDFLRTTAGAAAAGIGFPYFVPSHVLGKPNRPGPNEKLRVGFIGCGGRARHLMTNEGLDRFGVIAAAADCFLPRVDQALAKLPNKEQIAKYQDYRKMLEKEKLDCVYVPTPTHARALICIHAMDAGLDVYAEKPMALTVTEGRSVVKAVKHYNRVFQVGTQQRSIPINAWVSKRIRDGAIGKVIACNFIGPEKWEPKPGEPMPDGLDWDKWCNQAELRPYRKELQFGWMQWRAYDGGGKSWGVTGWGTHAFDQVQCALGTDDTGPVEIWPEDADETGRVPVIMRYASGTLLKMNGKPRKYEDLGAIFVGEKGTFDLRRGSCVADPPELLHGAPPDTPFGAGEAADHFKNFFECIKTRKKPNADAETGQRATTVCILVNICRELGRRLKWDPKTESFPDDGEANKLLSRPRRKAYELPKAFA
jgi:predicted dehydrogenase